MNTKTITLVTDDSSLKKELGALVPSGFSLETGMNRPESGIIFFDIDTIKPALIKEYGEDCFVVAITRMKNTDSVMQAVTFGAYEILQYPMDSEVMRGFIETLDVLREELKDTISLPKLSPALTCAIVGQSPGIMDVCKKLARLSQVEVPVLITGETGTGKELIAEGIVQLSSRFGKPFVLINCAAVPENLLESELFGHEKGSFTGAVASKDGMLKVADEGCVFFDEIGELPLTLQSKLLRFLQTQTFYPVGGTREIKVNVRVISATNRDLAQMVRERRFRGDLFHRLRVASIHTPPLRERKDDILPLIHFFLYRYSHAEQRAIKGFTRAFLDRMHAYNWPGNIRELENTIRSAIALSRTPYLTTHDIKDLGEKSGSGIKPPEVSFASVVTQFLRDAISGKEKNLYDKIHSEVDKAALEFVMSHTKDNQSEAARILGITRLTLRRKMG